MTCALALSSHLIGRSDRLCWIATRIASDLQQMHCWRQLFEDTFSEENRLQLVIKTIDVSNAQCKVSLDHRQHPISAQDRFKSHDWLKSVNKCVYSVVNH